MFKIKVSPELFNNDLLSNGEKYRKAFEKQGICSVDPRLKLGEMTVKNELGILLITMEEDGSQTIEPYNPQSRGVIINDINK